MLEWVLVIVTVFNIFFGNNYGTQTQARYYQTQYPQAVGTAYGTQQPYTGQWQPRFASTQAPYPQCY